MKETLTSTQKRIVLLSTIVLFLSISKALAQQGYIIINDFVPDSVLYIGGYTPSELLIDIDMDSIPDIRMHWTFHSPSYAFYITSCQQNIFLCEGEEGDTIPNLTQWRSELTFPERQDYHAIRFEKEGNYYYGWIRTHANPTERTWCFDKSVYCTIPNYPFQVGQTTLTGIEENDESNLFATLHPNPTNGQVTITGENLRKAEVVNMLGQHVLSVMGEGTELRINIQRLPSGVYFVNVTDNEGRRCVKKVVKE